MNHSTAKFSRGLEIEPFIKYTLNNDIMKALSVRYSDTGGFQKINQQELGTSLPNKQ